MNLDADHANALWAKVFEQDREQFLGDDFLSRWLFAERLYARNLRKEMSFFEYEGPAHIIKYMRWIDKFDYVDWFGGAEDSLAAESAARDRECLGRLGLDDSKINLDAIGVYNAQDYRLQRFYPVPDAQKPRVMIDFGAGHGRMANLALHAEASGTDLMIAVDGIAGSYLTQRAYYSGLGIPFADYIDHRAEDREFDFATLRATNRLLHLPTWRLDLVPDGSVDLVCCVQVLKELPRRMVALAIEQFARMVKPGGAIYIRDHIQDHQPNQMPIDQLLQANGFVPEFIPRVRDRTQIHGLPRIWRKFDPELLFEIEPQG